MSRQDARRALCGDGYAYGLWVQNFNYYKDRPPAEGAAAYARWLREQPLCGHKQCAGKREKRLAELEGGK